MTPAAIAGRSRLAGPLFMLQSACLFTAMNVLLSTPFHEYSSV
jgi:hypothetical protein